MSPRRIRGRWALWSPTPKDAVVILAVFMGLLSFVLSYGVDYSSCQREVAPRKQQLIRAEILKDYLLSAADGRLLSFEEESRGFDAAQLHEVRTAARTAAAVPDPHAAVNALRGDPLLGPSQVQAAVDLMLSVRWSQRLAPRERGLPIPRCLQLPPPTN